MPNIVLVMAGGAIGAALRYLVSGALMRALGPGWPWGTLAVNLAGGLAMGVLAGVLLRVGASEAWRLLLGVGVLGGFTTFSAFSLDLWNMIARGQASAAIGYALLSVIGSVAALGLGLAVARAAA